MKTAKSNGRTLTIAHKLICGVLLLVSLTWGIGLYAIVVSRRSLRESIVENSELRAIDTIEEVDRTVDEIIKDWRTYAYTPLLRQSLKASNKQFEEMTDRQAYIDQIDETWINVPKGKTNEVMRSLMQNELGDDLIKRVKAAGKHRDHIFDEVFITNRYGANVAQTGRTSDYRQNDELWWQLAKSDKVYVSDVGYDKSADVYSISVCIRAHDEDGNFLGVIKVVVNIRRLLVVLEAHIHEQSSHSKFSLLTTDQKLIYSCNKEIEGLPDGSSLMGNVQLPEHGKSLTFERKDKGADLVMVSCARSHGWGRFRGNGWMILLEHNIDEILAPTTILRNNILLISIVGTIFGLFCGVLLSISISRRITSLRNAAVEMGEGKLNVQLYNSSRDEVGQLTECFNDMGTKLNRQAKLLQEHNDSLKEVVESRTTALSKAVEDVQTMLVAKQERVKELTCMYGVFESICNQATIEEVCKNVAALIPPGWSYPEITRAKITLDGQTYVSEPFTETEWKQCVDIIVQGEYRGEIKVYYMEQCPALDEGPFLKEERKLIENISCGLGIAIAQKENEKTIRESALSDNLTGLPNRLMFSEHLKKIIAKARRNREHTYSLMFLDMDNFKGVNDTLGHTVADELLKQFSQRLVKCVRGADVVSRFGGDEFVIMMDDISPDESVKMANRIVSELEVPFTLNDNDVVTQTISIGITIADHKYKTEAELVRDADLAMYQAKNGGKNQVVIFNPTMRGAMETARNEAEQNKASAQT